MAANLGTSPEGRRAMPSPRPKGRDNAKNVQCRNIGIYGHCRYESEGCPFNHDIPTFQRPDAHAMKENIALRFNADSPAFTPTLPVTNGFQASQQKTISPKSVGATPFTPKSAKAQLAPSAISFQPNHPKDVAPEYVPQLQQQFHEFIPQSFIPGNTLNQSDISPQMSQAASSLTYGADPFTSNNAFGAASYPVNNGQQAAQPNPYANDHNRLSAGAYYQNSSSFAQPANYHLYAPLGAHREKLQGYQRLVYDLFVPQDLREEVQRRSEAALRTVPSSHLPAQIEHYHSLYPLDTTNTKNTSLFGYPTWVYKAVSAEDGKYYTLRRIEGFRLTSETAIRCIKKWKQVLSSSVVTIHDAFTTREFHDSSLIVVTDYHPCAKTVAEQYSTSSSRQQAGRPASNYVREDVLWAFLVQIATALKAIHANGLAAQVIHPSKVLVTSKNRIRLNACAIVDVVKFDIAKTLAEQQLDDFVQLGRLILSIASGNASAPLNVERAIQNLTRQTYTKSLRDTISWLISPPMPGVIKDIDTFLRDISPQTTRVLESTLLAEDQLFNNLTSEIENGRLVRLMAKLGTINERPEMEHSPQWSENGDRYYLKLFRDYVFHQVDEQGNPIVDLAHIISSLNKLDAGSEEAVKLMSRDEQHVLLVTYRELKRGFEGAFGELTKASRRQN